MVVLGKTINCDNFVNRSMWVLRNDCCARLEKVENCKNRLFHEQEQTFSHDWTIDALSWLGLVLLEYKHATSSVHSMFRTSITFGHRFLL